MRLPRIYINNELAKQNSLQLEGQAFVHLVKVLRLKPGAPFIVFNNSGTDYHCIIVKIEKKRCHAEITARQTVNNESPLKISLYQAVSKSEHMDITLQKATELGVYQIIPFYSQRSQKHLKSTQAEKKHLHWQKVIQSACEQCGRSILPKISPILTFPHLLEILSQQENKYLLHFSDNALSLKTAKITEQQVSIICGNEGGFTEEEAEKLQAIQCQVISLGSRILRTETAAISSIAILQALYGDLA